MKADAEHYREMDRQDRNTLRMVVVGAFLVVVFFAAFSYLAWQNHRLLTAHSTDIAQSTAAADNAARAATEAKRAVDALAAQNATSAADKTEAIAIITAFCTTLHVTCPGIPTGNATTP